MFSTRQANSTTEVTTSVATDFGAFRNAVSASFVPLEVTSDNAEAFRGRLRSRNVDDLHVTEVTATPHVVERSPDLINRADRHYYKISVQLSGTGLLIQDNREALLQPGDLAIYDTHRPYSLFFDEDVRTLVIMFGKNLIGIPQDMVGQLTAVRMSGKDGLGSMVVPFLARLVDNLELLDGGTGARIAHSALDLITTLYARELDLEHTATHPHHALMGRIRTYIDANLASPDLGPTQIAAAHYISTRHLHGIFKEHGTTVAVWVRQRRLHRCKRELCDPVHASRSVAAIAAGWGFTDAAHFSRVFRAEFGRSPSEVRLRASRR